MGEQHKLIERLKSVRVGSAKWTNALNRLLDAARTEGRGDGEPVAWHCTNIATGRSDLRFQPIPDLPFNRERWTQRPLYASPIREPEISRAKRDEIARIIDPEIFADLDLVASQAPQFIPNYSGQRNVDAAYAKADAILNLAHVGGRGEGWRGDQ